MYENFNYSYIFVEVLYNLFVFVISTSFTSQFTTQNTLLQYAHFRILVWWMKSKGLKVNDTSVPEFFNCNVHNCFFLVVFFFLEENYCNYVYCNEILSHFN